MEEIKQEYVLHPSGCVLPKTKDLAAMFPACDENGKLIAAKPKSVQSVAEEKPAPSAAPSEEAVAESAKPKKAHAAGK